MPEKEAPQLGTWEEQNFKTLEQEIDKEIDSLFIPAQGADEETPAGTGSGQESQPPDGESPADSAPAHDSEVIQLEIESEIDKLFVPSPPSATSVEASTSPETIDPSAGVSGLIEQFNAAYLSLDWDFSRENLKKFLDALEQLEPMSSRSSEAKSLFKIMEVILKRLQKRPHAVNTQLVQLIRDSQGLLAHLLLIQGESGPHEKRRLKELVEKFQELRQKALASKAARAGVPSRTAPDYPPAQSPPAGVPPESGRPLAESPPAKSDVPPALSATEPGRLGDERPLEAEKQDIAQTIASAAQPRESTDAEQRRVRHADACLLVSEGKLLALPSSCVVKAANSTCRIGRKVLERGYATLSDFKPLFRGAKSGVLGEWAKLHVNELGAYRFEPMGFEPAGSSSATGPKAVLTSDGQTHRIIFCDAFNFIPDAEIADESLAQEALAIETKSRVLVPFFDLSGLTSSLPGSPSTQGEE